MVGAGEVPDSKAGSLPPRPRTLLCWMWRSYLRTALVPLLVVELALIAAYFASNALTKEANIATARATAEESLAEIARLNAELAAERLATVTELTRMLQRRAADLSAAPLEVDPREAARFAFGADGIAYYTNVDNGDAARLLFRYRSGG